jgi:large subunit ribosomal protein L30
MEMSKAFLVVRISGQADVPHWANTTLNLLKLEKKFRATIIPDKENTLGMLNKIKHYVSWQEIDISPTKELLDKKARKSEDITQIGFKTIDDLATSLTEGKTSLSKLSPLKPWFALAPPRKGFKKSTKKLYGEKGILGHNKELGEIVRRMI